MEQQKGFVPSFPGPVTGHWNGLAQNSLALAHSPAEQSYAFSIVHREISNFCIGSECSDTE